ncbi:hypothetical protein TRAPUB_6611 [Trametes pubescens]|uniref:F-box domain-containing protein n=1 Tax=Trametes pubescens TaxID=154538 RepID=A0A1M2V5F9_TRAPU|nr:hypothetical protein TRAPUB_6611 [Trametes pubescens]
MESCRLPLELCEEVMNALLKRHELPLDITTPSRYWFHQQQALCACALTCRAWRVRAQHLLLKFPHIRNSQCLASVTTAIQQLRDISIVHGLVLDSDGMLDLSTAGGLFMSALPHLQHLTYVNTRFDRGPPLRLLRMRLPFFAGITVLRLHLCTFQSLRSMLDVVWACRNVVSFHMRGCTLQTQRHSPAAIKAACEHLRPCQKLTRLEFLQVGLTTLAGSMFGAAVTELVIAKARNAEFLSNLLAKSFPALRSITVIDMRDERLPYMDNNTPSWLHAIAASRAVPGGLKKIVLRRHHVLKYNKCCREVVGSSMAVVGTSKPLSELLSGLEELTIGGFPVQGVSKTKGKSCNPAYIKLVIPTTMHTILRFEN